MDVEEIKKIIQDKIEADEAAREVRSKIKTYIHQKQDAREGFTETFKPLIETSEKVKESIDTQQNKLIKQLQENQLALTAGFEGNRKAITSGFDKMDEVKKWDLGQLPGYEAIEEEAIEEEAKEDEEAIEDEEEKIKFLEKKIVETTELRDNYYNLSFTTDKEEAAKHYYDKFEIEEEKLKKMKEELEKIKKKEKEIEKEPVTITDRKIEERLNKYLGNQVASNLLKEFKLKLPYEYSKEDKENFLKDFEYALKLKASFAKKIGNLTKEKPDITTGITKRVYKPPKKGSKALEKTKNLLMVTIS